MGHLTVINSKKMALYHRYIRVCVQKVLLMKSICFGILKVECGIGLYMKMVHRMVQGMIELV